MNWLQKSSSFTYSGKLVTRRKAIFDCVLGHFEVHEAVGGNAFVIYPGMQGGKHPVEGAGLREWFGLPKKKVINFESGLAECERALELLKTKVAAI
jgi:hypothetical protein